MAEPIVNGEYYSWANLEVQTVHGPLLDFLEISYDHEEEGEDVYGQGSAPRGYGRGNFKGSGKLKILREEYSLLLAYCKAQGKSLYRIPPVPITVNYYNEDRGLSTDQIKGVRFTKVNKSQSQNDKSAPVEIEYKFLGIEEEGLSQTAGLGL